jgi:hypothetical protein
MRANLVEAGDGTSGNPELHPRVPVLPRSAASLSNPRS